GDELKGSFTVIRRGEWSAIEERRHTSGASRVSFLLFSFQSLAAKLFTRIEQHCGYEVQAGR
ncbi:MAG: hypothetical protein WB460_04835, partial [Candidatus Acidiferrales bacterium]